MTSTLEPALDRLTTSLRSWDSRAHSLVLFQVAVLIVITPWAHLMLHIAEGHWRVMFFGGHAVMALGLLCTIAALVAGSPAFGGKGRAEDAPKQVERIAALTTTKVRLYLLGLLLFLGGLGSFGMVWVRYGERMILP